MHNTIFLIITKLIWNVPDINTTGILSLYNDTLICLLRYKISQIIDNFKFIFINDSKIHFRITQ